MKLDPKLINYDVRLADGYYTDKYFCRTKDVLSKCKHNPIVRMQVFQRNDNVCVCGISESVELMNRALGAQFKGLKIRALTDGTIVNAWETVMIIEGPYQLMAIFETVYLGILAKSTRIATNVYRSVKASGGKPVYLFNARFGSWEDQAREGYAYAVGCRAAGHQPFGVSTDAQGAWIGLQGTGTMPHSLIAAFRGNTALAALNFCETQDPHIKRIVLVDYANDCVGTALETIDALYQKFKEFKDIRYKLFAVHLDTSATLVDASVMRILGQKGYLSDEKPTGVNMMLVHAVRKHLDLRGCQSKDPEERKFYRDVRIMVSGGFTVERIRRFEELELPVSIYAVGSSIYNGNYDFTADLVTEIADGEEIDIAKVGRTYQPNDRLEIVQ